MAALPAAVGLPSPKALEKIQPLRALGAPSIAAIALRTIHDEDPDWILTDFITKVPATLVVPSLRW